jgi:hypothetical protein
LFFEVREIPKFEKIFRGWINRQQSAESPPKQYKYTKTLEFILMLVNYLAYQNGDYAKIAKRAPKEINYYHPLIPTCVFNQSERLLLLSDSQIVFNNCAFNNCIINK